MWGHATQGLSWAGLLWPLASIGHRKRPCPPSVSLRRNEAAWGPQRCPLTGDGGLTGCHPCAMAKPFAPISSLGKMHSVHTCSSGHRVCTLPCPLPSELCPRDTDAHPCIPTLLGTRVAGLQLGEGLPGTRVAMCLLETLFSALWVCTRGCFCHVVWCPSCPCQSLLALGCDRISAGARGGTAVALSPRSSLPHGHSLVPPCTTARCTRCPWSEALVVFFMFWC